MEPPESVGPQAEGARFFPPTSGGRGWQRGWGGQRERPPLVVLGTRGQGPCLLSGLSGLTVLVV